MLEMLLVLIIVSVLVAITVPKIARVIQHERVNRAAQVIVQDLQNGFALAGRQRAPVRLTFTPSQQKYVFSDRLSGTTIMTRVLSTGADYSLTSFAASSASVPVLASVDVLPNGIGSTAFTVTIANGTYTRVINASSAGFVRLIP